MLTRPFLAVLAALAITLATAAACNEGRPSAGDMDVLLLGDEDAADGSETDADGADGGDAIDTDEDTSGEDVPDGAEDAVDADDVEDGSDGTDIVDVGPVCGDGTVDDGEACDDGDLNSDDTPDSCRTDCTTPTCGDGVIDTGELCDDGNTDEADECTSECTPAASTLCHPCFDDSECGGAQDACIVLESGSFCGTGCAVDGDCPDFFRCAAIDRSGGTVRQCLPVSLSCEPCFDPDDDGYGEGPECDGSDCNQRDPLIFPGATEVCDDEDNDCDGQVDEPGAEGTIPVYADGDRDEWGDTARSAMRCGPTDEYPAEEPGDCDDGDPVIHPGAAEVCDGEDNDCDPDTEDGVGDELVGSECDGPDDDFCTNGETVCTDGARTCDESGPSGVELCDGEDNDCNPDTPDGADDDRIGVACDGLDVDLCVEGETVCAVGDVVCGDETPTNVEICNDRDDDCDGDVDEGAGETWYPDTDEDGWGVEAGAVVSCADPGAGWAADAGDCEPGEAAVNPGADEVCDNVVDDDCNGRADCADAACAAAPACGVFACLDGRLGSAIGLSVATGSNASGADARSGGCDGWGREMEYLWTAPAAGRYVFDTVGSTYDTVLSVLADDCDGAEVACNDDASGGTADARVAVDAAAGATYVIVVDARSNGETGTYVLNIAADIDEVCDNDRDDDLDTFADCDDRDCELFSTCCPSDVFEPNQGTSAAPSTTWDVYSASPDAVLTVSTENIDSFRLPVCYRAAIRARARFDSADANVDLRLLWPNGSRMATASSTDDDEVIEDVVDIPFVDRVFLQAYVNSDVPACTEYTLEIDIDRSDCP